MGGKDKLYMHQSLHDLNDISLKERLRDYSLSGPKTGNA